MPLLVKQQLKSLIEPSEFNLVALDGSTDSFPYSRGEDFLLLENTDSSPITVTLIGNEVTSVNRPGITTIDVSSGKAVTIPANGWVIVRLIAAEAYLTDSDNQPDITGGAATVNAALFSL